MKKITFIRHGETLFNALHKFQGRSDIELNQKGIEQALQVMINDQYDIAYHSGLKRSTKTLEIILNNNNINVPIEECNLLQERKYGIFEGLTHNQISNKFPTLYSNWKQNPNVKIQDAESIEDVIERIKLFLKKIYDSKENNIICVSHSGTMNALYKWLHHEDLNTANYINIKNCDSFKLLFNIDNNNISFSFKMNEYEYNNNLYI